jgi:TPR repeat protein
MADNHDLLILPNQGDSSIVLSEPRSILAARGRKDALSLIKRKPNLDSLSPIEEAELNYSLGVLCYEGEKVPKDYQKAVLLYRKAADEGHMRAQCSLGLMYDMGHGVPQNRAVRMRSIT